MLKQKPEFKTLTVEHLRCEQANHAKVIAEVKVIKSAILLLTGFAIIQLLEGAELFYSELTRKKVTGCSVEGAQLILKLSKALSHNDFEKEIPVMASELGLLKTFLEMRMHHCEKERDEQSDRFNSDTYIGMKFLLLDIRELMLGDIIFK